MDKKQTKKQNAVAKMDNKWRVWADVHIFTETYMWKRKIGRTKDLKLKVKKVLMVRWMRQSLISEPVLCSVLFLLYFWSIAADTHRLITQINHRCTPSQLARSFIIHTNQAQNQKVRAHCVSRTLSWLKLLATAAEKKYPTVCQGNSDLFDVHLLDVAE